MKQAVIALPAEDHASRPLQIARLEAAPRAGQAEPAASIEQIRCSSLAATWPMDAGLGPSPPLGLAGSGPVLVTVGNPGCGPGRQQGRPSPRLWPGWGSRGPRRLGRLLRDLEAAEAGFQQPGFQAEARLPSDAGRAPVDSALRLGRGAFQPVKRTLLPDISRGAMPGMRINYDRLEDTPDLSACAESAEARIVFHQQTEVYLLYLLFYGKIKEWRLMC